MKDHFSKEILEPIVKKSKSKADAENTLNICSISKCISGKRRSAGGYI